MVLERPLGMKASKALASDPGPVQLRPGALALEDEP